jgi:endogenous inhibitor of DNA gyrase (YacG/DUF329 family)
MTDIVPARPCPICGKPAELKLKPFCSVRCADVDLNRWFSGVYAVPARESEDAQETLPSRAETQDHET